MTVEKGWRPPSLEEERETGNFGTYEFSWGVASYDYTKDEWFHIIPFKDQTEHQLDYYPMGTTFHVHPNGFIIETPAIREFDPVALGTLLQ